MARQAASGGGEVISVGMMTLLSAAYRYAGEVTNPVPDLIMIRSYRDKMIEAELALTTDERVRLNRWRPPK